MGADTVFCGADNSGVDFAGAARAEEKILVIVEWRDIIATNGWEQEPTCPTLFSVGWLTRYDSDTVTIANTKDPDDFTGESSDPPPLYYGFHSFPRGVVVSVSAIQRNATE